MIPPAEKGGRTGEHANVSINRKKGESFFSYSYLLEGNLWDNNLGIGGSLFLSWGFYLKSKEKCLNLINWLISHNSSGYAFSSLLFIFFFWIIIMEYLELAEFSNYGTNCFRTGGTRSGARTLRIWKISREKVLAPVSHICTPVYPKYPNGVRPSTICLEKVG